MSMPATLPEAPAEAAPAAPAVDPSKAALLHLLDEAPDGMDLVQLSRHLELVAGIRQSEAEFERGEGIPVEQVRKEMATWFTK